MKKLTTDDICEILQQRVLEHIRTCPICNPAVAVTVYEPQEWLLDSDGNVSGVRLTEELTIEEVRKRYPEKGNRMSLAEELATKHTVELSGGPISGTVHLAVATLKMELLAAINEAIERCAERVEISRTQWTTSSAREEAMRRDMCERIRAMKGE